MIEYDEEYWITLLFRRGSSAERAVIHSIPACIFAVFLQYLEEWQPGLREDLGLTEVHYSQLWAATSSIVAALILFRAGRAYARFWEGTGLLHQMRGEWFDTVSNCVSFSNPQSDDLIAEVVEFRHTLVRLMSLCHGSAIEEISGDSIKVESIDTFGLNEVTLSYLQECHHEHNFNKVEVMLHLIQSLITLALNDGILHVPAPVCSRVYQTISRGFVNLLNAKKIQDTRFPFPYAQLIYILLVLTYTVTPCLMTSIVTSKFLSALFTFIPTFTLWNLNFISIELEDPFGVDDNDLPLHKFQVEMNNCLMMLLHPSADLRPSISRKCETDFYNLKTAVTCSRDDAGREVSVDGITRMPSKRLDEFNAETAQQRRRESTILTVPVELSDVSASSGHASADIWGRKETNMGAPSVSQTTLIRNHIADAEAQPSAMEHFNNEYTSERGGAMTSVPEGRRSSERSNGSNDDNRPATRMGKHGFARAASLSWCDHYRAKVKAAQVADGSYHSEQSLDSLQTPPGASCPDVVSPRPYTPRPSDQGVSRANFADFATLSDSMDGLLLTLQRWTRHVEEEVDNLQLNSASLKEAIHSFASRLPTAIGKPANEQQVMVLSSSDVSMTIEPIVMTDSKVMYSKACYTV